MANESPRSEMILYQTEDGRTRIECRFENETHWLTQALIAELFQKDVRTINEHLVNIYDEGEVDRGATLRKLRIVRTEGSREVSREIEHYSLPAILAVGYRVRSLRGTVAEAAEEAEKENGRVVTIVTPPRAAPGALMSHSPFGWRHWLSARFFFPVAAASLLALAFFAEWHLAIGPWTGPRLELNLALAWAPYLFALWAVWAGERRPEAATPIASPGLLWLAFFPNAPYLVTDWLYLEGLGDHLWFSIGLFMTFSLCGLLLAVVSLYLMHTLVRVKLGRVAGWVTVALAVGLAGLGVYMGRFLRLNSWELATDPQAVLHDVRTRLGDPHFHATPLGFTIGFAAMLACGYYVFLSVRRAPRSREEQRLGG
jgi:uncharacterized membrane protein